LRDIVAPNSSQGTGVKPVPNMCLASSGIQPYCCLSARSCSGVAVASAIDDGPPSDRPLGDPVPVLGTDLDHPQFALPRRRSPHLGLGLRVVSPNLSHTCPLHLNFPEYFVRSD
jgi:hypothetical protein